MSWGEAIVWGYIATAVLAVLPCARVVLRSFGRDPEKDEVVLAAFMGLFAAAVWPLVLVVAFVFQKIRAEVDREKGT